MPVAAASVVDARHVGTLLSNFNGVSSLDSAVTNFGAEFEPPDQGLCVGNGFVLEPVNSAFTIYHTDGSVVAGPFNVNDLFAEDPLAFTSDRADPQLRQEVVRNASGPPSRVGPSAVPPTTYPTSFYCSGSGRSKASKAILCRFPDPSARPSAAELPELRWRRRRGPVS